MGLLYRTLHRSAPQLRYRLPAQSLTHGSFLPPLRYFSYSRSSQTFLGFPQGAPSSIWSATTTPTLLPASVRFFSVSTQNKAPQNKDSKSVDDQPLVDSKQTQNVSQAPAGQAPKRTGLFGYFLDAKDKFKEMIKSFGYFVVAAYFSLYLVVLSLIYMLVKLSFIPTPDVNGWINNMRLKKVFMGDEDVEIPDWCADFATAWVITKTTEPVRLIVTIAAVPILLRKLPFNILRMFRISPEALSKVRK